MKKEKFRHNFIQLTLDKRLGLRVLLFANIEMASEFRK